MFDDQMLQRLRTLSDDELRGKVAKAAAASGIDAASLQSVLRDIPRLRGMLGALNAAQINALLAQAPVSEIAKRLDESEKA